MWRWLWIAAIVVACGSPKTRPRPRDPVAGHLCALAVADDDFYRPILYTWTAAESIPRLRETKKLLVATATSGDFVSPFNQALAGAARNGDKIAMLLTRRQTLTRRRYAWPAPFATVMGLGNRTYGTALIRIELRPDAWIGRFDPYGATRWAFRDAAGTVISELEVLATPDRVGAIFHVRVDVPAPFREFVVTNEAMVAAWSIGTPEIGQEIDAEIAMLRGLRDRMATMPSSATEASPVPQWAHMPGDALSLWPSALAFDNPRYRPRARQLDAILAALAAYDPTGPPLVVKP